MMCFVRVFLPFVALACFSPALADTPVFKWNDLQAACTAQSAAPVSAFGQRLANIALGEQIAFDGHKVGPDGRLYMFGSVESEGEFFDELDPRIARHTLKSTEIPWMNVLRYWKEGEVADSLRVRTYADPDNDGRNLERRSSSLADVLTKIEGLELKMSADEATKLRRVLRESVIRASLVDTAWSAAFISAVVRRAEPGRKAFSYSSGHISYITRISRDTLAEFGAAPKTAGLYRACDIYRTRPRVGDIVCYHREHHYKPHDGLSLFQSIFKDVNETNYGGNDESYPLERKLTAMHCDIVVRVRAKEMSVIGGNVLQAVTEKRLRLNGGVLSPVQAGETTCTPSSTDDEEAENCNLNRKNWFVLLQNTGG